MVAVKRHSSLPVKEETPQPSKKLCSRNVEGPFPFVARNGISKSGEKMPIASSFMLIAVRKERRVNASGDQV